MNELKVSMDEWFFTQGLVGFKKIMENYGQTVKTTYDGIVVERAHLEMFPDAFFQYYLTKYSYADRQERTVRRLHKQFKEGDNSAKRKLNRELNDIKKSAQRYFKDTKDGKQLAESADTYRKEKKYTSIMDELIEQFLESLHSQEINEKLTSNYFKAVQLGANYGQVSFLNVTHNRKTFQEQKEIFYKDFIYPILAEWNLFNALESNDEEKIEKVLNEMKYQPFNQIKRGFRKKTLEEQKQFINENIHRCSLTDYPLAFQNFEEMIFVPLALSIGKARNMSWNANHKDFSPICSLARLILFCAHAGATDSSFKSVFVYYGGSFDEVYQSNLSYDSLKDSSKTFDQIVFDLVREQKLKADYLNNRYMIYEYESDYQLKRTLLDYMIMKPHVMKLFSDDSNLFNYIHYGLKNEMIRFLLRDIDSRQLITTQLREKIKHNYPVHDIIRLIQIRHLNERYRKEIHKVDSTKERNRVWALVKSAEEVKRKIGIKKAQGIAYRLLNSVRSNDKNTFMDTVMRVYISSELEMPGLLLEALHENKMDFATVGNAWIAGLVTKGEGNEQGEKENE